MSLKGNPTPKGGPTDKGSPAAKGDPTDKGSPAPERDPTLQRNPTDKGSPAPERDPTPQDPETKRYVEGRKKFFQDKLREKNISKEERDLYELALQLYEKKKLPGKEGRFVSKLIQDDQIRDMNYIHFQTPHCIEVSVTRDCRLVPCLLSDFRTREWDASYRNGLKVSSHMLRSLHNFRRSFPEIISVDCTASNHVTTAPNDQNN